MNNKVEPRVSNRDEALSYSTEDIPELCEDMEMVSPGSMLVDARKTLGLSQEHIAEKLNFKLSLVKDIEEDKFDPTMPITFIRGYLANYAKLVAVEVEDVLASYDALDAASIQRSEMLSFSKATSKQAEHSRVMWFSYLIVALLIGLTVLWWQQESSQQTEDYLNIISNTVSDKQDDKSEPIKPSENTVTETKSGSENVTTNDEAEHSLQPSTENSKTVEELTFNAEETTNLTLSDVVQAPPPVESTAVFTFKGDCWVNIFDATGERIAWGVKKAGYVMTITGIAPLRITVGKPELTSIVFNGQAVDMSPYNVGNIAKFNLPIGEYSAN